MNECFDVCCWQSTRKWDTIRSVFTGDQRGMRVNQLVMSDSQAAFAGLLVTESYIATVSVTRFYNDSTVGDA